MFDEVIALPSGTEISVEAALGDLSRAIECLREQGEEGLVADLMHVQELLRLFAWYDADCPPVD